MSMKKKTYYELLTFSRKGCRDDRWAIWEVKHDRSRWRSVVSFGFTKMQQMPHMKWIDYLEGHLNDKTIETTIISEQEVFLKLL